SAVRGVPGRGHRDADRPGLRGMAGAGGAGRRRARDPRGPALVAGRAPRGQLPSVRRGEPPVRARRSLSGRTEAPGRGREVACPGSFAPVTNGHLDIIRRAARLHDEVLVVVGANLAKEGLFTVEERLGMLREVTSDLPNVSVDKFTGLLVDFCRVRGVSAIVK